jgi:conserved hypothetical protein
MKYKRRVLVAVTGMSPQILTETVYALYTQQNWLPDEIFVLTTQIGYNNIMRTLIGENGFLRVFAKTTSCLKFSSANKISMLSTMPMAKN